jgi:dipeptidyl aminopeptidase/acylaminoacyl peptidase
VRKTDGSLAVKIGEGVAQALSPDGKWALSSLLTSPQQLLLLPTGAGEAQTLPRDAIDSYLSPAWFPDGKRILFSGKEAGHRVRVYLPDVNGGKPRPITPEGVNLATNHPISADGRLVVVQDVDQKSWLYPTEGGDPRPVPGVSVGEEVRRWSADGRSLYIFRFRAVPAKIDRVDLATGRREQWRQIAPSDPAGTPGDRLAAGDSRWQVAAVYPRPYALRPLPGRGAHCAGNAAFS